MTQHGRPEFRTSMSDVTSILNAIEGGDPEAADGLAVNKDDSRR